MRCLCLDVTILCSIVYPLLVFCQAVGKSKKAREVDGLLLENESLQRKLVSQEEEFRLQNSTLMQELGGVCQNLSSFSRPVIHFDAIQLTEVSLFCVDSF